MKTSIERTIGILPFRKQKKCHRAGARSIEPAGRFALKRPKTRRFEAAAPILNWNNRFLDIGKSINGAGCAPEGSAPAMSLAWHSLCALPQLPRF
jgi:hypothetical protein